MPPSRAWPNASVVRGGHAGRRRPGGSRPRRRRRSSSSCRWRGGARSSSQTASMSTGHSGIEDRVGAAGDAGVRGDPACVAAHHLDDHHAVVALGGRAQPVDRVRGDLHRRVEPERVARCRRGRCRSSSARRRPGRPPRSGAPRRRACPRRRSQSGRRRPAGRASRRICSLPSAPSVYGFVREVPRIVPAAGEDSHRRRRGSSSKESPFMHPAPSRGGSRRSWSCGSSSARRTIARITAFSPGQSPPPVRMPTRATRRQHTRLASRAFHAAAAVSGRTPPPVSA